MWDPGTRNVLVFCSQKPVTLFLQKNPKKQLVSLVSRRQQLNNRHNSQLSFPKLPQSFSSNILSFLRKDHLAKHSTCCLKVAAKLTIFLGSTLFLVLWFHQCLEQSFWQKQGSPTQGTATEPIHSYNLDSYSLWWVAANPSAQFS